MPKSEKICSENPLVQNNCLPEKTFNKKGSEGPKVLLSGVFGPFGVDDDYGRNENVMELFHNQVTKAQGSASLRLHHRSFGLYFMAENIDADVTVLDFPSKKAFIKEVSKKYDIVGISFIAPNFSKAREMARLVREISPDSIIILGGHGAAIESLEKLISCDYVVKGEGIAWLRAFLGQDTSAPITHPEMASNEYHRVFGIPMPGVTAGLLVPGVGCDYGCRFCSTTHFFGKSYKSFIPPEKLFETACSMYKKSKYDTFFVLDENFLRHAQNAKVLLSLMIKEKKYFKFHIFASADAVIDFGIENLARLGVHLVWIGVESKTGVVMPKNQGIDHAELVSDLRNHGISVLTSSILCMEHHNQENIKNDIEYMINLKADMCQFMLLTSLPVTGVYNEHKEKGVLKLDLPYEEWHGQKILNYVNDSFPDNSPEEWINFAFKEEYERNSSSILRMLETAIMGYKTLSEKGKKDEVLKIRALQLLERIQEYRQLIPTIKQNAVNPLETERCGLFEKEIQSIAGPMKLKQLIVSRIAQLIAVYWNLRVKFLGDRVQPKTIITYYHKKT